MAALLERVRGWSAGLLALTAGLLLFAAPIRAEGLAPPPPPPPPTWPVGVSAPVPLSERACPTTSPAPAPTVSADVSTCDVTKCIERRGTPEKSRLNLCFDGYLQIWWRIWEQTENGRIQPWTNDDASDVTSGFSILRARVAANLSVDRLRARLEVDLAHTPRLMDAYVALRLCGGRLEPWIGQMKVPSTYEVETASRDLDFVTRSVFSASVVNWSLSKSPSNASPMFGVQTYLRDLGIALKGEWGGLRYFVMAGNGLGANLWIGGTQYKEYLWTNDFGSYLFAGRLEYDLIHPLRCHRWARCVRSFRVGGHYSYNDHPDVVFNDERTVLDLKRSSWSADARIDLLGRVRLTGMIGAGTVEDDFDYDDKTDYEFRGWEVKAMAVVIPDCLEAGVRYDVYEDEFFENGAEHELASWSFGVNYQPWPYLRLQMNYVIRDLMSPTEPDLDDDALVLVVQFQF